MVGGYGTPLPATALLLSRPSHLDATYSASSAPASVRYPRFGSHTKSKLP